MLAALRYTTALLALLLGFGTFTRAADDVKTEELVQKHLDSIGSADVRAAAKSRVVEGTAAYRILVGGSGQIMGKAVMASEGQKLHIMLKINANKYHGEKFIRNGGKTFVAGTYDDGTRSEFGEFLRASDFPLREGLLGGSLSTGWPLLDLDARGAKLHPKGTKKIEGQELYAVNYQPKKATDMDVTLYFEPNTYRHVMTVYSVAIHAGIGATEVQSARQNETRYRIEERFSDFKTVDGLTLPSHYDLRFQQELQNGFTKLVEWDVNTTRVLNNIDLDARNFETH